MRLLTAALLAALAFSATACSKSDDSSASSSATDAGGAAAASAAPAAAGGSSATAAPAAAGGDTDAKTSLPTYPGATSEASGSQGSSAGTVLTTDDSFDKVYDWYKSKLPAGSEKAKLNAGGVSTATFQVSGSSGKGTVVISTQPGNPKTTITLAQTPG
jgi:hypothetical protein